MELEIETELENGNGSENGNGRHSGLLLRMLSTLHSLTLIFPSKSVRKLP